MYECNNQQAKTEVHESVSRDRGAWSQLHTTYFAKTAPRHKINFRKKSGLSRIPDFLQSTFSIFFQVHYFKICKYLDTPYVF